MNLNIKKYLKVEKVLKLSAARTSRQGIDVTYNDYFKQFVNT